MKNKKNAVETITKIKGIIEKMDQTPMHGKDIGSFIVDDEKRGNFPSININKMITREEAAEFFSVDDSTGWDALSFKERRIAALICLGLTNKEIARRMVLSDETIKSHVHHIFTKLGVHSRIEVINGLGVYDLSNYLYSMDEKEYKNLPLTSIPLIKWENEDDVPWIGGETFKAMINVRKNTPGGYVYPYIEADNKKYFLVELDN
jgi:DNA-binding CsgD family transcriptional regulator